MKLLICTQAVDENDPVLGFFVRWIAELAKRYESVEVICLREGQHTLPLNVRVHPIGKGNRLSRATRLKMLAWKLRRDYDTVFVHMNPEYLIVAGPLWHLLGKRTAFWYLHKAVNLRLRIGVFFADIVFTASPMSMRLTTPKKTIVGHGIDFSTLPLLAPPPEASHLSLLSIGRLSSSKQVEILIDTLALLRRRGVEAMLTLAGAPATSADELYVRGLKERAQEQGIANSVRFIGAVPHARLAELLGKTHLFLHASATGSLDKTPLEALASGVPVITVNPEFIEIPGVVIVAPVPEAFIEAILPAIAETRWADEVGRQTSRAFVEEHYALPGLIDRLYRLMEEKG